MFKIEEAPSQKGKIAIVTGANIGLGFETAIGLAKKDAKVIMACRNMEKAENAKKEILNKVQGADLEVMHLDLNSKKSIANFASSYNQKYSSLDVLINNAGIMIPPFAKTEDGFESQFGVNYLGHFYLTALLFEALKKSESARVVSLSSMAHKGAKIDFDNLNAEIKYSKFGAYGQSKLACLMFAYELQRKLNNTDQKVISLAAHPGGSETNLVQHVPKWLMLFAPLMRLAMHSPESAARPTLLAAISEHAEPGGYYGPTGFREVKGDPGKVDSNEISKDLDVSKKLWEVSEQLLDYNFEV